MTYLQNHDLGRRRLKRLCSLQGSDPASGYIAELSVLGQFRRRHPTANGVRHAFAEVPAEETVAVVHDLLRFCILSGIRAEEEIQELQKSLELWKDNRTISDALNELNRKGLSRRWRSCSGQGSTCSTSRA